MILTCRVTIEDSDVPKPGFVEWVKSHFDVRENPSGMRFEVRSDAKNAAEFAVRLRDSFVSLPLIFCHIDYSKTDLDQAQLLHVWCDSYIAELAHPVGIQTVELAATKALKNPRSIGAIRPFGSVVAVNQSLRDELDHAKLVGLQWTELRARGGKKDHLSVWRMMSSVVLPDSPIPLKNTYGDPLDGDIEKGCQYCSPYREVELAYDKESMRVLGEFDAALTKEHIGNYMGACFQELVISQRFRAVLESKKLRGIKYTPVRLLEPGEPVIRDPFAALEGKE